MDDGRMGARMDAWVDAYIMGAWKDDGLMHAR